MNNPINRLFLSTLKIVLSALWTFLIFFPMLTLLFLLFVTATLRAVFFEIVRKHPKRPIAGSVK